MAAQALEPSAFEFTRGSLRCVSSPLWGRNKEGGRTVLRDKRAVGQPIFQVRATPHP
jgi:hypothetical protein